LSLSKGKYDVGVLVARFQVPELHQTHRDIINNLLENHKIGFIVLGVSETLGTKENPLNYAVRNQMILKDYPEIIIAPIMDNSSDKIWSQQLDKLIQSIFPLSSICLYGGRDSFISHYKGLYPTYEFPELSHDSGTQVRIDTSKKAINSIDFRKGIIYGCHNQYPKAIPTVDVAIIKDKTVLMGKPVHQDYYKFPGGFVDPTDPSYECAAKREMIEEIDCEIDFLTYVCSARIDDWRYTQSEKILTTLYKANYIFGSGKCVNREFIATDWIALSESSLDQIVDYHKILFKTLLNFQRRGKKS
tara:strand:+ start:979 stop:1884 length:906 start_codon:yes stop_codon:yes gene_type:complete